MNNTKFLSACLAVSTLLTFSGCAHGHKDRDEAEDHHSRTHAISIGDPEVRAGDRIDIFRETCVLRPGPAHHTANTFRDCSRTRLGGGTVVEIKAQDHSQVLFDAGVPFEGNLVIEKAKAK